MQAVAPRRLTQRGHAASETFSRKEVQQRVEAGIGGSQTQGDHDGLLHGDLLRAVFVCPGQEVQVHGTLDVVRGEAEEEGQQDDDDHSNGPDTRGLLPASSLGAGEQRADYSDVADPNDQEGQEKPKHQANVVKQQELRQLFAILSWRLKAFDYVR